MTCFFEDHELFDIPNASFHNEYGTIRPVAADINSQYMLLMFSGLLFQKE